MGRTQQRLMFSKVGLGAARIVAVAFVIGLVATQPARAQTLHVLYNFAGSSDGGDPYASLIRDTAGNLYSTFGYGGGTSFSGGVFKVAPDGTETVLYSFTGGADGAFPFHQSCETRLAICTAPLRKVEVTTLGWCSRWIPAGPRPCCTVSREVRTE